MEIKVKKVDLKKAIFCSRKALSKVVIQEERGHLLFTVSGSEMIIQGTNNDLKAKNIVAVENISNEDFSFTADPKILEKLITKVDVQDVLISFNKNDYTFKVYTTESGKSFSTLQSFLPDKMLTFNDSLKLERKEYLVNKMALIFTLNYTMNFLAPLKEDQKQYDFVVINKGIAFAANGSNKMGFIVFKTFEQLSDMKIRKQILPLFKSYIENLDGVEVKLFETEKDIGVEAVDDTGYFSFLKSTLAAPKVPKEHIISEGPHIKIDKNKLLKVMERVIISNISSLGIGIELKLTGSGEEAGLDISLLSKNKSLEAINCVRIEDSDEEITHVVDYKLFKSIIGSFDTDKEIRLHINDHNKFFKIYDRGEVDGQKYILAGIGTYAKILRQVQ